MPDSKPDDKSNVQTVTTAGVKDTIESILIAFILAFVFRAYAVEAFVIPTGSMGTTLLGAHMRFTCPDCGYHFDVSYSGTSVGNDIVIPSVSTRPYSHLYCPNCGYHLPQKNAELPESNSSGAPVRYGDRILVLKYVYLMQEPHRWDVVVFKSPASPKEYGYTQNYIKRLIGRPGESIMVLDGDIYASPTPPQSLADLQKFRVQRKPRLVQESMWRIVYDNDFYPTGLKRSVNMPWRQPWTPAEGSKGWTIESQVPDARRFGFDNLDGSATLNFDAGANPFKRALTDFLAYDQDGERDQTGHNIVGDLKMDFYYQRKMGDGPLKLVLGKDDDVFTAGIEPTKLTLTHRGKSGEKIIDESAAPAPIDRPIHVEFMNADYRLTLRIDGKDMLSSGEEYQPDLGKLLDAYGSRRMPIPTVRIIGEKQNSTLTHLKLWRDVYYTNDPGLAHATPYDFPRHVANLKADEYFVMGDNSPQSSDARFWTDPIELKESENLEAESGRVPGRFLLGKAFFVYWPAGFQPIEGSFNVVPDFGEMRFIH